MSDAGTIAASKSSAKTAFDIAKAIRDAGVTLERTEDKLKFAELIGALADTKMHVVEIKGELQQKSERIAEVEQALEIKRNLSVGQITTMRRTSPMIPTAHVVGKWLTGPCT